MTDSVRRAAKIRLQLLQLQLAAVIRMSSGKQQELCWRQRCSHIRLFVLFIHNKCRFTYRTFHTSLLLKIERMLHSSRSCINFPRWTRCHRSVGVIWHTVSIHQLVVESSLSNGNAFIRSFYTKVFLTYILSFHSFSTTLHFSLKCRMLNVRSRLLLSWSIGNDRFTYSQVVVTCMQMNVIIGHSIAAMLHYSGAVIVEACQCFSMRTHIQKYRKWHIWKRGRIKTYYGLWNSNNVTDAFFVNDSVFELLQIIVVSSILALFPTWLIDKLLGQPWQCNWYIPLPRHRIRK